MAEESSHSQDLNNAFIIERTYLKIVILKTNCILLTQTTSPEK